MNLKTIAQKAGVSTATVSNVINGNHHKVSLETLQKVQKIIEENDYKPNATARSLASKKSKIIGVVIPHISADENFFVNPYNAHMLAVLEEYVRNQGYYLMVRCVGRCTDIIPLFASWNVDGVILFGAFREDIGELRSRLDVPTVYIDTYAEDMGIVNVGIDDYKGGYLAAGYLLGRGHREIAFVGPRTDFHGVIQQRYFGFRDACREHGVEVTEENHFSANTLYRSGIYAGQQIAMSHRRFTAVIAMSDIVAFGVMEGLRMCGRNIPDDVSVVGFDNLPESQYSNPKLTTVSQNVAKKARTVGQTLFGLIRGEEPEKQWQTLDVELIERQSVRHLY